MNSIDKDSSTDPGLLPKHMGLDFRGENEQTFSSLLRAESGARKVLSESRDRVMTMT